MNRVSAVKIIGSIGLVISMLLNGCTTNSITDDNVSGNDLTATEVIRLMGNGINLGNTLEAYNHKSYVELGVDPTSFETLWGQPVTTRDMIDDMKAMGFDTLRIPVAWTNGINYESGDYTIDERLMNRVDEVVNYALDADMYVILNEHWDGSWWGMFGSADEAVREKGMALYKSMWTQISEHFSDYSYKLIFESANEEMRNLATDSTTAKSPEQTEFSARTNATKQRTELTANLLSWYVRPAAKMQTDSCLSQGTTPTSEKHAMTDTKCRKTLQRTSFCFQYIITRRGTIAVTAMQNGGELPAITRSRIPFFRC